MSRSAVLIPLLALLETSAVATPPEAAPPTPSDIVVKAQSPDMESRNKAAVGAIGRPVPIGGFDAQYARWHEPACVAIEGLTKAGGEFVADRIGQVAREIGAGSRGPGCRPNIYVVVTNDPRELIEKARTHRGGLLTNISNSEVTRIERATDPIRWVGVNLLTGADGDPAMIGDYRTAPTITNRTGSLIKASTQTIMARMVVIVDGKQIQGMSYRQLAGYLSLVTLAQLRPHASAPMVNTILSAFDRGADAPQDLTDFDVAYLKALYAAPVDYKSDNQRMTMVGNINRRLAAATTEPSGQ